MPIKAEISSLASAIGVPADKPAVGLPLARFESLCHATLVMLTMHSRKVHMIIVRPFVVLISDTFELIDEMPL